MASRRYYFNLATIKQGGSKKLYALGGNFYGSGTQKTVEEWEEQTSTWKTADSLVEKKAALMDFLFQEN